MLSKSIEIRPNLLFTKPRRPIGGLRTGDWGFRRMLMWGPSPAKNGRANQLCSATKASKSTTQARVDLKEVRIGWDPNASTSFAPFLLAVFGLAHPDVGRDALGFGPRVDQSPFECPKINEIDPSASAYLPQRPVGWRLGTTDASLAATWPPWLTSDPRLLPAAAALLLGHITVDRSIELR